VTSVVKPLPPLPDHLVREAARMRAEDLAGFPFIAEQLGLGDRRVAHAAVKRAVARGFINQEDLPPVNTHGSKRPRPAGSPKPSVPTGPKNDWQAKAVCRDEDPELFFPVGTTGPAVQQIAEAKAVCQRCPVIAECLAWALKSGQGYGVWGGMSEQERRSLKRNRTRPSRAKAAA